MSEANGRATARADNRTIKQSLEFINCALEPKGVPEFLGLGY